MASIGLAWVGRLSPVARARICSLNLGECGSTLLRPFPVQRGGFTSQPNAGQSATPPQPLKELFAAHSLNKNQRQTPLASPSAQNSLTSKLAFQSEKPVKMASKDRDVLPDALKPTNYTISLYGLELGGAFGYQGTVKIDVDIKRSIKEVVLNANQLKVNSAEVIVERTKTQESFKASTISYNEKLQRVTLLFPTDLPVSSKALLVIDFNGTMNSAMAGFYRSKYKPAVPPVPSVPRDEEFHYMFSTQFESCDARRAFPCFDEPNLKATFDFEIEIPEDQVALSNMPEKEVKKGGKPGLKIVSFDRTPVMSTYPPAYLGQLLAWAFGDFEYTEDFTARKYNGRNLPVRVYTTKGLKEQGRFALKNAAQIVDYFSEVFRIDYPLPKVDLLAVHEFTHGAMENWGLITYRTTAVLYDEASSDARYKNRVAYVVAHELAHQWFGNLVTMDWWSELWLNEGFATWTESVQTAFQLDSLRGSHPIEVPVKDALEIDQIFDHISYLKGSSVIRMLSGHLGVETFLMGVSNYLKAHQYKNATTGDLWAALSEASGQDVNGVMDNWIKKIGFPVVTITEKPGQIAIRQNRFLLSGDVKPEEDETTWWIPLGLRSSQAMAATLTSKTQTLQGIDESFYKLNTNNNGFFRTNYPPDRLAKLGALKNQLSVEDKIGLIGDAAALAVAGHGTTAGFLAFIEGLKDEDSYLVWAQVITSLTNVRSIFAGNEEIAAGLRKFTLQLVTPAVEKIGWEFSDKEDFLTGQLRALLISAAGGAGHKEVIKEAHQQFKLYTSGEDRNAIHQNLRLAVFRTVIEGGGRLEYEAVKNEYLNSTSVDGKEICLSSMGRIQTPDLLADLLAFMFSDQVAVQDMHTPAIALATNPNTRLGLWQYVKQNWPEVSSRLSRNMVVFDRWLRQALNKFSDHDVERDIAEFFKDKDNTGYDRSLNVISDTIKGNAKYKDRDELLVLEWLKAHGYA
ncbi:hypothetical protein FGG08_003026 [Glutinoglossum americanum]|uniref:Aminopeptidase n=1 Tax=Glutinoglossum americanum TaxID=1670608 RepID=A0A9P8HZ71_9PEZI|nr:hypothetical protein FGG08_003026 [Glutinoglossum americanum]